MFVQTRKVPAALPAILKDFVGAQQRRFIGNLMKGEEGEWFAQTVGDMAERIRTMPKTYEQDGKGAQAVVVLHYFTAGADWWILEKDMEQEQHQAFGIADIGYGPEMGYISLPEILAAGAEIDLHWQPITREEMDKKM